MSNFNFFPTHSFNPSSTIQALWIDIDGTLLDFDASSPIALRQTFEKYGYPWKENYFSKFEEINESLWRQIEAQRLDRQGLGKVRFPYLFEELQLPLADPQAFENDFCDFVNKSPISIPGAREGLQALQESQLPLFIITNGTSEGQRERLKNGQMIDAFEEIFVSEDEDFQVSKPNPLFFQKALTKTRRAHPLLKTLTPQEIVVIGDSWKADIQGGLHFGAKVIWIASQGKDKVLQSLEKSERQKANEALLNGQLWIAKDWNEILKGIQFFSISVPLI